MGLGDDILKKLRDVFGRERKEQMAAESPSSELALAPNPSSPVGTLAGQDRGLLTISPTLMGRYQDYECLVGDTKVLTLMGPVTLKELSDLCGRDSSYQFAVYTWDHKEGRITVGMGCRARWVKKAKVVEVELDDGQKFLATENHRWMRRDGSYAETKELRVGDSLMPLYLSKDTNGYVMYRENSDWHKGANTRKDRAKTRAVARMAAEWKLGRRMNPGEYVFINIPDRGRVDVDKMVIKPKEEVQTTRTLSVTPLTQLAWEIALFVKENERLAVDPRAKAAAQDLVKDKRKLGLNSVLPEEREKAKRFWNHKIAALRDTGTEQDVYCLDVPGTHNYAIGNESGGVFTHNCMADYPDINCLAGDTKIVVYENSIVKEVSIGEMASSNLTYRVVVWNKKTGMLEVADAIEPRLSGREADVFEIKMSNGRTLKATAEHKVLVKKEDLHYTYKDFIDLKAGDKLVGMPGGYSERIAQSFLFRKPHEELVLCDPYPAGKDSVYDITTEAHNFVANGVVVHNSALWYFGSDSTQPHPTTGRVVWVDSDDEAIKGASETLLRRRLRIDDEMFSFAYELAKMGNLFLEPLVTENGVVGLNCLATHTVRRIEHENKALVGYAQDLAGMLPEEPNEIRKIIAQGDRKDIALFEDWQVVHARLRATSPRSSYGRSVVDGARWIWKRLLMLEDSMILYKLTRAAARYAYYIDVTDIPANKVEAFLQKAKRDLKKHKYVDPNTGQMNMRFNPLCLAGDTLIETRDGPIKIEDLVVGFQNGLMFEVYTSDVENGGRVGFGNVAWAGKTRENAELLKITLDNGHVVRVTPDHKMIRRSGDYAEAQDLQIGDSLMPFYLKESKGEDVVYCPQRRKFVSILSLEPKDIDVQSHNHRVLSIERLSEREDTYTLTVDPVHTFALSAGIFVKNSNDEDIILAVRDGRELSRVEVLSGADYQCLVGSTEIPLLDGSKKTIKEMAEDGGEFWVYSCTEKGEVVPAVARNARISHNSAEIWEVELDNGEIVECTGNHPFLTRAGNWILAENLEPGDSLMPLYCPSTGGDSSSFGSISIPEDVRRSVGSVKLTGRFETVYDLTVDGTHCFAVGQGVFVHNSIDDVSYFQRKLHGVLKVPRTWLGQEDAPPGRALLSNEDSRSARVTMTIQTSLRLMVERIIRIDMAARGVSNPWKPVVDVQMTQPSGIATLAYMEVQNALADYATRIEPYVSKDFIRRHYLKLTEDQIDTIEKQKEREKKVDSGGGGFGSFSAAPEFINAMESIGLTPENAKALGMTQGMVTKLSDNIRRLEERFDRVSKERHDHLEKKLEQVLQKDAAFRDRHNERMAFFRQLSEMQKRNRH